MLHECLRVTFIRCGVSVEVLFRQLTLVTVAWDS